MWTILKGTPKQFVFGLVVGLVLSFMFTGFRYTSLVSMLIRDASPYCQHPTSLFGGEIRMSNSAEQLDREIENSPEKPIKFVDQYKHHGKDSDTGSL